MGKGGWWWGCLFFGKDGGRVSLLKRWGGGGELGSQAGGRGLGLGVGVGSDQEGTQTI